MAARDESPCKHFYLYNKIADKKDDILKQKIVNLQVLLLAPGGRIRYVTHKFI
jgi:hypothetical protein